MPPGSRQSDYRSLPQRGNRDAIISILDRHVDKCLSAYRWQYTLMAFWHYYRQGHRHFPVFDLQGGRVGMQLPNDFGRLDYVHQELVARQDAMASQLGGMDVSPSVRATGTGLGPARGKAVAQAMSDAMMDPLLLKKGHTEVVDLMTTYGSVGLQSHVEHHPTIGPGFDLEPVSPWEVLPFPVVDMDLSKTRGLMRRRLVPVDWLKESFGSRRVAKKQGSSSNDMDWFYVDYADSAGTVPDFTLSGQISTHSMGIVSGNAARRANDNSKVGNKDMLSMAIFEELWLDGPRGSCSRYLARSGGAIFEDIDFGGETYFSSLSFERFMRNGTFYGIGIPGLLFHLNRRVELMLSRLFEFVETLDRFGILAMPAGMFDHENMVETPHGAIVAYVEPESWQQGNVRPQAISPNTPGEFPGRVAALGQQQIDRILPIPEILRGEAPGRVEGAQGLGILQEQAQSIINTATEAIDRLYGSQYKSGVAETARAVAGEEYEIPVTRLSLDLLGARVSSSLGLSSGQEGLGDDDELKVSLSNNPLPNVSSLGFGVRARTARMKQVRKAEVNESLQMGKMSGYMEMVMLNYAEHLEMAIHRPDVEATMASATLQALLLFNDGKTPGKMLFNQFSGNLEVVLATIERVMATPEFLLSSQKVKAAFVRWKKDMSVSAGKALPGLTPTVDEAAALADQAQRMGLAQGPQ